jgi:hypothetical protein
MKTDTIQHTEYAYFYNESGDYTIVENMNTKDEDFIAMTEKEEHAKKIVKAVNNYDALLSALIRAYNYILSEDDNADDVLNEAREAINKAAQ